MALPKKVQEQADEAKRIQDSLNKTPEADPPAKAPAEAEVQDKATPDKPAAQDDQPAADGPPVNTDQDEWKKRFVNLKRKYDEIVPQLRQENEDVRAEMAEIKQRLESLDTQAKPQEQENLELTPEDIDEYGTELISLVTKVSKSELAKQIIDLNKRLDNIEKGQQTLQKANAQNAKAAFFTELTRLVPDWQDINADIDFRSWLAKEVAPGHERQEFLMEAQRNGDVTAVAKFFTDWKSSKGSPRQQNQARTSDLSKKVVPDNSGMPDGHVSTDGRKMYTTAQVSQFYRDKREGRYRGREEEARRIEIDILAAGREGRVVQ